ncbi:MAG TPA: hypothetical protein VF783_10385, partial [Terriglobales bacterium]
APHSKWEIRRLWGNRSFILPIMTREIMLAKTAAVRPTQTAVMTGQETIINATHPSSTSTILEVSRRIRPVAV